MKVRIKKTGEIVEVSCIRTKKLEETIVGNKYLEFTPDEIEILSDNNSDIDFEQRRFELVKAAMQGFLANSETFNQYTEERFSISVRAINYADKVLAEYKKRCDKLKL